MIITRTTDIIQTPKIDLSLYKEHRYVGSYSDEQKKYKCSDIYKYVTKFYSRYTDRDRTPYLSVKIKYKWKYYPVVDVDTENDMVRAIMWLKENNEKYTLIASNPGSYWIIINKPYYFKNKAVEFMSIVPGNDDDYINFSKNRGIYLRAQMKLEPEPSWFIPKIIDTTDTLADLQPCTIHIAGEIIKLFESPITEWYYRQYLYKSNKIDIYADIEIGEPKFQLPV